MTAARTNEAALTTFRAAWRRVVTGWHGIPREDLAATYVFALAFTLFDFILYLRLLIRDQSWVYMPFRFLTYEIGALALMAGVVAADSVPSASLRRGILVLALVASAVVVGLLNGWLGIMYEFDMMAILVLLLGFVVARGVRNVRVRATVAVLALSLAAVGFRLGWQQLMDDPEHVKALELFYNFARPFFWNWLLLAGAATFVYLDRRRTQAARARRHAAEVDRARSAKRALESRLQAMQARVEPQFLFNTLAQVKRSYELDPDQAERMLDDLIAYLRAAMPRMRDTSSTVGQEIELARAYLAIVKVRLGDRLRFDIELPADLAGARMPPMMLLPLIDHAVVHGLEPSKESGSIRIAIAAADSRLRLTIADSGAGFVPDEAGDGVAGIRERLDALFGVEARLDLDRVEQPGTRAVMEIPYERMEGDDR